MFVFPANKKAQLPEVFRKHSKIADFPVVVPARKIMENREIWVEEWTDAVLRN